MTKNDLIPLIIDSNYDGFQIIHTDVVRGYSIACKFSNFDYPNGTFDITESQIVIATIFGEFRIPFFGLSPSEEVNSPKYGYQMETDFSSVFSEEVSNKDSGCTGNKFKRKLPTDPFSKDFLIDVLIDRETLVKYGIMATINHGQEFCRFYII